MEILREEVYAGVLPATTRRKEKPHLIYTAKFDGKDYPADVASSLDTVALKRIDDRTVERIGKAKGQVIQTETYIVSPDGKMLTVKQEGTNNGVPFKSAQLFERSATS